MIVCKYKFDKSIYENLIPIFNDGYNGYTITDVTEGNIVTRTIECSTLPSLIRFGNSNTSSDTTAREHSLLYVYEVAVGTNIITGYCMFRGCKNLSNIEGCDKWDTSNVTNMRDMFNDCSNLTSLDVSNFDTSNVTNMAYMFYKCRKLTSLDLSNWVTSKVNNMREMFYECNALSQINQTNLVTSTLLSTNRMFYGCNKLTSLDVSNWDTSNVTDMGNMFLACYLLTELDVSNWVTSNVTTMHSMFSDCQSLISLDLSNFDTSKVTDMYGMFGNCNKLTTIGDVSNWDTSKVTSIQAMFFSCKNLTSLDVSNFDTSNVASMSYMFHECKNLTSLDVSNWNTSNVTNMYGVFSNCQKLTSLDLSNFDTSKVTNMNSMFSDCTNLTSLDVSNFNTSKVTDIAYMFSGCSILQTVGDLTNWDTKNLEFCHALFYRCFKLKHAHMSGWNTSKVRNVRSMFAGCESIEIIDMHNFDLKNAYDNTGELFKRDMFQLKYLRINDLLPNDYAIDMIPSRTGKEQGVLISDVELSEETLTKLQSKNWTVVSSDTLTKVAEYVYDSNTWNSMLPEFNDEFVEYFIDDVEDENGLVTRTISSIGGLPTLMRFGRVWVSDETNTNNRTDSLLKILDMNTSGLTSCNSMFRFNANLTSINCKWDTKNVTDMYMMFLCCLSLTSLDLSNFDTSNVTNMRSMFNTCLSLTSLDLSNFDTSNVTNMIYMFAGSNNLTSLDLSNFDTSKITSMECIFYNCNNLTSLDLSNFDTSNVTNMRSMFHNTSKLSDIDMLYCTPSTINKIASNLPTTRTQTIWVKDTKPSECTVVSGVEFKEYKENSYMINLSSPLLDGDRIEVVDGKLCHYHKMGMIVLNGSEDWSISDNSAYSDTILRFNSLCIIPNHMIQSITTMKCDTLKTYDMHNYSGGKQNRKNEGISLHSTNKSEIGIWIDKNKLATQNTNGLKQWLQENPTTVVYGLANPYYEDITPIQSDIVLETYLESNLDIYTKLPIKTNVSYITNVPSLSTLSMRATEMKESDNILANLTNMLDNEINE